MKSPRGYRCRQSRYACTARSIRGSLPAAPLELIEEPEPDVPELMDPEPDVPAPDVPEPDVPELMDPEPDVPAPDVPEPDVPELIEPDVPVPDGLELVDEPVPVVPEADGELMEPLPVVLDPLIDEPVPVVPDVVGEAAADPLLSEMPATCIAI
jgi:hypothetical protein